MDLKVAQKCASEPFIDQNAPMLRVVDELDHIEASVVALQQVSLCATPHFANQVSSAYGHEDNVSETVELISALSKKENTKSMAEDAVEKAQSPEAKTGDLKSQDDTALELMKFIAVTTGYGRGSSNAGFGGKGPRTSEEYAESLLELFDRCRVAVRNDPK
jgi:hypothetical protein